MPTDKSATVIAVWNQVVLPSIVADLMAAEPGEIDGIMAESLQLAAKIAQVNNPGTRPPWAKDAMK